MADGHGLDKGFQWKAGSHRVDKWEQAKEDSPELSKGKQG